MRHHFANIDEQLADYREEMDRINNPVNLDAEQSRLRDEGAADSVPLIPSQAGPPLTNSLENSNTSHRGDKGESEDAGRPQPPAVPEVVLWCGHE